MKDTTLRHTMQQKNDKISQNVLGRRLAPALDPRETVSGQRDPNQWIKHSEPIRAGIGLIYDRGQAWRLVRHCEAIPVAVARRGMVCSPDADRSPIKRGGGVCLCLRKFSWRKRHFIYGTHPKQSAILLGPAHSCLGNLFLDPDKGLTLKKPSPQQLSADELVEITKGRSQALTVAFDQSFDRRD